MRKMFRFHIPACAFLLVVIVIVFTSGCAFTNSERLLSDMGVGPELTIHAARLRGNSTTLSGSAISAR